MYFGSWQDPSKDYQQETRATSDNVYKGPHGIYNNESALGANRLAYAIFSNFADCFGT